MTAPRPAHFGWLVRCNPHAGTFEVQVGETGERRSEGTLEVIVAGERVHTEPPAFAATVTWERSTHTLRLTRDATGQVPLFTARMGDTVLASPDLNALLVEPGVSTEPDPVTVAEWLLRTATSPERTLLASIDRVPAGHSLVSKPSGTRLERYWSPPPPGTYSGAEADRFGENLEHAIARIASDSGSTSHPISAVYLSGGIDSASVTTAAASALAAPPLALSVVFEGASEERTQRRVAEELRLPQLFARTSIDDGLLERGLERVAHSLWPTPALWAPFFDHLAAQAVAHGASVLLDGQGGDELLDPGIDAGRALRRRPLAFVRWLRAESRFTSTARSSLRAVVSRRNERPFVPGWLTLEPAVRCEIEERLTLRPRGLQAIRDADLLDPIAAAGVEEQFTHSRAHGLEHRHPLWDPAVVEHLFGLDPAAFSAGGMPKSPAWRYVQRRLQFVEGPWPPPEYGDTVLRSAFEAAPLQGYPSLRDMGITLSEESVKRLDLDRLWAMMSMERWVRSLRERGRD